MTLTVELPDSLEQRIRDRAAQLGGDPETVIANLVRDHFAVLADSPFVPLTDEETKWFKQVNEVPAAGVRQRWRELDQLRQTEPLDENQQAEMATLYDQIEANHARRLAAAAELAKLRQVSSRNGSTAPIRSASSTSFPKLAAVQVTIRTWHFPARDATRTNIWRSRQSIPLPKRKSPSITHAGIFGAIIPGNWIWSFLPG